MMTKKQIYILVSVFVIAILLGSWYADFRRPKQEMNLFDRILPLTKSEVEWEFAKDSSLQSDYIMKISPLTLKADNTLEFSVVFPHEPLVLESVLGSQLTRQVFQIPWQTINTTDSLHFSGIDMSRFNPFESFQFYFVYEYDAGYRARHLIEFEL